MQNIQFKNMDKNIYRLIKPYQSTKVYEAKTTMHGAGKCYKELKSGNVNCDVFSIQNLADNSVYDFKVDFNLKNNARTKLESLIIHSDNQHNQNGGLNNNINNELLQNRLLQIENRLQQIENKISLFEQQKIKI